MSPQSFQPSHVRLVLMQRKVLHWNSFGQTAEQTEPLKTHLCWRQSERSSDTYSLFCQRPRTWRQNRGPRRSCRRRTSPSFCWCCLFWSAPQLGNVHTVWKKIYKWKKSKTRKAHPFPLAVLIVMGEMKEADTTPSTHLSLLINTWSLGQLEVPSCPGSATRKLLKVTFTTFPWGTLNGKKQEVEESKRGSMKTRC